MELTGQQALTMCAGCAGDFSHIEGFWLVPYCPACAARHYKFDPSQTHLAHWDAMTTAIRSHVIAPSTRKRYETEIKKTVWPLTDAFSTTKYLRVASSSESAMKQAIAAARRLHLNRAWSPPPFDHPLVASYITTIKKQPIMTPLHPRHDNVLTNKEVQRLFAAIAKDTAPIHHRDAAILALQLFGVRRASEVLTLAMNDVQWDLAARQFQIRIKKSKTDPKALGLWYRLPRNTALDIDPTHLVKTYMRQTPFPNAKEQDFFFRRYLQYEKRYSDQPLSVSGWNERLTTYQLAANLPRRTSHAIRATAISLTPMDDVHTVSQVGGWKSMTYLTAYHRTPIDDRTTALANIGKRILLTNHSLEEKESDRES